MNYWWVNQNQTHRQEVGVGIRITNPFEICIPQKHIPLLVLFDFI